MDILKGSLNTHYSLRGQMMLSANTTIGNEILGSRGLNFNGNFFWISIGCLFGFTIVFNIGFTLALTFLKTTHSRAIISKERLSQILESENPTNNMNAERKSKNSPPQNAESHKRGMVLPFEPLTLVFEDVQYYVDTPVAIKERGSTQKKLQLLTDITSAFTPGVLTALMGVSGAGKTTLLDVLSGRKTIGMVEGTVKIGGYPKVQETFVRIFGYCEQNDIHSPYITVEESVIYSSWLRLHPQIDSKTKVEFVKEVLNRIELYGIKDVLVGMPGISGLSTEQRKRLTMAVELVANPSIIFMDEPTTGLDARAAAIVMRAVKNVADSGRTIVCTIHQPSIDIFEAFDELILLKKGGRVIYSGPVGRNSSCVVEYFESVSGVPKIKNNVNPATWMLEVTSTSSEAKLGVDFSEIYKISALYVNNKEVVRKLSSPHPGSKQLHFSARYAQSGCQQFKACLWKQHLSYWRSPSYCLMCFVHTLLSSLLFGVLFWNQGTKINNQQSLFTILGSMYAAVMFCGINKCASVLPYVSTERSVIYRERYVGMYASWFYVLAQVIIEVPYIFANTLAFTVVTYPMMGYYWSAYKFIWYFYAIFSTLMYFTYLGMLIVAITPSFPIAAILQSAFYSIFNLFNGFMIPQLQIPKWWIWLYYLTPTSWTLNGLLTSQYGDIQNRIKVFGETKTVATHLSDYFGFHTNQLPVVAAVLILYPVFLAFLFACCIEKLNFQRR